MFVRTLAVDVATGVGIAGVGIAGVGIADVGIADVGIANVGRTALRMAVNPPPGLGMTMGGSVAVGVGADMSDMASAVSMAMPVVGMDRATRREKGRRRQ